jgi:hypothetical protein
VRDEGSLFAKGSLPGSDRPYHTFEQLFIRTSSPGTTADGIDYRRFKVERIEKKGTQ